MIVKINENHYFKLWMGRDKGSNTKAQLLGLWGVFFFSNKSGIDSFSIFGDLKVIIEWEKGDFNLQVLLISFWCRRVKGLCTFQGFKILKKTIYQKK